jgi:hypothetical protein
LKEENSIQIYEKIIEKFSEIINIVEFDLNKW